MQNNLSDILFPLGIKCLVCDDELPKPSLNGLCKRCKLIANKTFCSKCGRFISDIPQLATNYVCEDCDSQYKPIFSAARAPYFYDDNVSHLIHQFKYGGKKYLAQYLARDMAQCFNNEAFSIDFITFVPMHRSKKRVRGYNQAEILASYIGELINKPVLSVLEKVKKGKNAASMSKHERYVALAGSIGILSDVTFNGQNALLIDDVFTSGATSQECSRQLKLAGIDNVFVLTYATSKILI